MNEARHGEDGARMDQQAANLIMVAAVLAAIVLVIRYEVFILRDIANAGHVRTLSKPVWTLLSILWIPFGGLLWWLYGRPR
jgi:hypothetical protein